MKLLTDFFPILLFFIVYKLFGIYHATVVAIAASLLQVIVYRLIYKRFERMHIFSLVIITVLGGATLFLHDPQFIKLKPTGVYWVSSLLLWGSMFIGSKPIIQKMMDSNISLSSTVWKRLNHAWAVFFLAMGFLNLYVVFNYSTDTWVNFKLFGGLGITLIFVFMQALYLTRHINKPLKHSSSNQSPQ